MLVSWDERRAYINRAERENKRKKKQREGMTTGEEEDCLFFCTFKKMKVDIEQDTHEGTISSENFAVFMFVLGMIHCVRCCRVRQSWMTMPVVVEDVASVRWTMDGGRRAEIIEEGHVAVGIVG